MKLDFDTNVIRKNKIELLDCQVDLILNSLELYLHTYQFIYEKGDKEECLRLSLVSDTYKQIMDEYVNSKNENPVLDVEFLCHSKKFEKIS